MENNKKKKNNWIKNREERFRRSGTTGFFKTYSKSEFYYTELYENYSRFLLILHGLYFNVQSEAHNGKLKDQLVAAINRIDSWKQRWNNILMVFYWRNENHNTHLFTWENCLVTSPEI